MMCTLGKARWGIQRLIWAEAKLADCRHESRTLDLVRQAQPDGRIELARAVNGDAVARPAEPPHQERHSRGVRAEVHVHVVDPLAPHDVEQVRGFKEVRQVSDQPAVRPAGEGERVACRGQEPKRARRHGADHGKQQRAHGLRQAMERLGLLGAVGRIGERRGGSPAVGCSGPGAPVPEAHDG
jgi:hypothetical protein